MLNMEVITNALIVAKNAVHAKLANIVNDLPFLQMIISIYAPFFVVSLVAYSLSSRAGLRYWLALQQAPTVAGVSIPTKIKRLALLLVFTVVVLGTLAVYFAVTTPLAYGLLFFILYGPTKEFIGNATGMLVYSVHRVSNGGHVKRLIPERSKYQRLLTALSAAISIGALVCYRVNGLSLDSWVGFAAWTYALSTQEAMSASPTWRHYTPCLHSPSPNSIFNNQEPVSC